MTNSTNTTLVVQRGIIGYIIAPFAIITIVVNILFFILGLKVLKKKAHNIFVISTCGGDSLHDVSLFILALLNKISLTADIYSDMCISQITVYFLSISFTLTVALMICLERYITVKKNNFGAFVQSEGWRKKMAATMLSITTGYVIVCMLSVQKHTNNTHTCYLVNYYDPFHYRIIMGLIACLFLSLVLAIIVVYALIVYTLLKYKAKGRKVVPRKTRCFQNKCQDGNGTKSESQQWKQWEVRALATCVFIIGSTLVLLCPLVFCIVADAFGYDVPIAVGSISALLFTVRSVIDPFLYVFRFQEIRNVLTGKCCSKEDDGAHDVRDEDITVPRNCTEHVDNDTTEL